MEPKPSRPAADSTAAPRPGAHPDGRPRPAFDPVDVGRYECDAWVGYYRRDWPLVLRAAVGMVRFGFALPWPRALLGAWYVLRANQVWAPYPDNDPAAAVRLMTRFYRLVVRHGRYRFDPARAARLEVDWWHEHRILQRETPATTTGAAADTALVEAITRLYAYVYSCDRATVRPSARWRAHAMTLSDAWVAAGCSLTDPLVGDERLALVRSYTLLLDAVSGGVTPPGAESGDAPAGSSEDSGG